ncbi:hypothetical protein BT69DRAFT_980546 [Atractiella rhizophila]|nr:hypothetical protein BT69DRAFT_980546 [Atractiella rhizophila]
MKSVIGLWDENGVVRPDAFQSTEKTTREVKRKPVPKMDQDEEMAADGWQDVTEEDYRPPAGDASNPNGTSTPRPSTSRPPNSSDIVMTAFDGRTVPIEPTSTIRTSLAKSLPRRLKTTRRGTLSKGKTSKILNYDVVQNDDASGTVRLSQIAPKVKSNGRIGGSSLTISHFLSRLRKQEQSTDEPSPSNAQAISAKSSPEVPAADPASIRTPLNESGRTDVPGDGRTPEVVDAQPPVPPKDDIPPAKVSQESRLHEPAKRDHPQEVSQQSSATEPPPMTGHTQDPSIQFSDASSSPGDESDIPTPMREDPNPTTISTFLSLLKEETEGQLREQDPSNATNEGALPDPGLPQSNDPSISKFLQQLKRETEGENRPN